MQTHTPETWADKHRKSERLASQAEALLRAGNKHRAQRFYARAADAEDDAIASLDVTKTRTLGISIVSTVSLRYKAGQYQRAKDTATAWLSLPTLPAFASTSLLEILARLQVFGLR